jgi:phytoene synthase
VAEEPFDALVRRVDEDRWLASRFAPASVRAHLMRLYALVYEIARTAEQVRDPRLGDIRLQYWREAVAEAFERGSASNRGVLAGLDLLRNETVIEQAPLQQLIDARASDLDEAPFATWDDLHAYLDGTAGAVLQLALQICARDFAASAEGLALVRNGGRAWGLAGLARVFPIWDARRRTFLPAAVRGQAARPALRLMHERAGPLLRAAAEVRAPQEAFPAFGYLALTPLYLRDPAKRASLLRRQVHILFAAASGRI